MCVCVCACVLEKKGNPDGVAEVVMRWLLQEGIVPIVKASTPARLAENLDVDDFELAAADMDKIRSLDRGRLVGFDPNLIS